MIEFVSISNIGSIRILDVPLGVRCDYVKKVLRTFDLQENNNCLYLENVIIDNLPPINIRFDKDNDDCIDRIYISQSRLNQKERDALFKYFKTHLVGELNIFSDIDEELVLSNHLHRVIIGRPRGIGNDENRYPFFILIKGTLMGKNEPELKYAMKQLYLERGIRPTNKPHARITISQVMKILFFILALIVAFLFALNGRYAPAGELWFMDKWTKILIVPNDGKYEKFEQKYPADTLLYDIL